MNSSLMQRLNAIVLLVLGHGLLAEPLQAVEPSVPSGLHRTNVILIMADDVGWEAFGVMVVSSIRRLGWTNCAAAGCG